MNAVPTTARRCLAALAFWAILAAHPAPARGQAADEDHEKHHPADGKKGQPKGKMGGKGGMGGMMEGMGKAPPKQLYPSLMGLDELTPERREEVLGQARTRMQEGAALLSGGVERMAQAAEAGDDAGMQEALAQMREGLSRLDSGLAARRAVAEGRPPRDIALRWLRREMNLTPPAGEGPPAGPFGLSWFHFLSMILLAGFAAAMFWMYYHKMQRAAQLLEALAGGDAQAEAAGTTPAAAPPPADGRHAAPEAAPASPAAPGKWSGRLRVSRIFQETPDVKTFRLMNPLGGVLPFAWLPGQFLTVTVAPDGKPVRRSYTISSSPTQHDYAEITVRHEGPGLVSGFLHGGVKEGDLLEASGPSGAFTFTGRECKCILLVAGGVGVTPLMSVIRYLTDRCWAGDIYLLYSVRSPQDIIFREELEYLQRRHANLRVVITASRAEGTGWSGPAGRITKELIAQSVPDLGSRYVHVCGPVPMMEAVKKLLAELGVPPSRVKTEAFGPALGKPEPARPPATPPAGQEADGAGAGVAFPTVTFARSEKSAPLPPDKAILDVADVAGVEIDNSCRVGTCGTCRVRLLSGQVTMAVEDGLEPGDKEKGIILACQARSAGDVSVEA